MGNFNRRDSGARRSFDNRGGSDRPQMFRATCSNCGKDCEVPFRPNGSKPVLCSDCFRNGGGGERRNDTRSFGRQNNEDRQMFDAVCSNCGNECQIPFEPRSGRPVFCSRCFEKNEGGDSRRNESRSFDRPQFENRTEPRGRNTDQPNYKAQFDALNAKMDTILALLSPKQTKAATTEPLESIIDEKVIDDIVEEIEEVKVKKAPVKKDKKEAPANQATKEVKEKKTVKKAAPKK